MTETQEYLKRFTGGSADDVEPSEASTSSIQAAQSAPTTSNGDAKLRLADLSGDLSGPEDDEEEYQLESSRSVRESEVNGTAVDKETLPSGTTQEESIMPPPRLPQLESTSQLAESLSYSPQHNQPPAQTSPELGVAIPVVHIERQPTPTPTTQRSRSTSTARSPRKKAKLSHPASSPARRTDQPLVRVFANWKDTKSDQGMFPATIVGVTASRVDLLFDDYSTGTFDVRDLRKCSLKQGDKVRIRHDMTTSDLAFELDYTVSESTDELDPMTVVPLDDMDEEIRACQILIPPSMVTQLGDRKIDKDVFEFGNGYDLLPLQSSKQYTTPPVLEKPKLGVFSKTAFVITSGSQQAQGTSSSASLSSSTQAAGSRRGSKSRPKCLTGEWASTKSDIEKLIEKNGGLVADFDSLVDVRGRAGTRMIVSTPIPTLLSSQIERAFVIASGPATTTKYFCALASGIPCVSQAFIAHAICTKSIDDWRSFLLPAGSSVGLGAFDILGAQSSIQLADPLSICERRWQEGVFAGHKFLIALSASAVANTSAAVRTFQQTWRTILACAGAVQVDFVKDAQAALVDDDLPLALSDHDEDDVPAPTKTYDHLIVEEKLTGALAKKVALVNGNSGDAEQRVASLAWIKECLIMGKIVRLSDL